MPFLLKHERPLHPLGPQLVWSQLQIAMYICTCARMDLPCYHLSEKEVLSFSTKKPSLSDCIFFINACLDFGFRKSSFPLGKMMFG